jgi:ATP-dependent Lhr-like helicase
MPLALFDPLVAEWFRRRFEQPTEPQRLGWPEIGAGRDVLISAPTGAGKTLAAFLISIDRLVRAARSGALEDRLETVYVSPLKALSHDVQKNLERPLAEIQTLAQERGIPLAPLRAAVRTGDTTAWERRRMLDRPPHLLVTTPESLFLLLTAEQSRRMLRTARAVIVDEIHAVVDDKRGAHLALTLARLDALVEEAGGARPQRIGLSATVNPIDEVARFLGDEVRVVDAGSRRDLEIAIEVPKDELGAVATHTMWEEIADRLAELIEAHRATLVFVNTRRLAERLARQLAERLGEQAVLPHHGSLSRKLRLAAEERLKNGQLRAVVATASLELGIDVGTIDLVCQIGSPRSIATAMQRIGRSGHWLGARPKGIFFPTTRDELLECAALARAIRAGRLDRIEMPRAPLDVLAQQVVAEAACRDWGEDELYALVRRAQPYRDLAREEFDAVLAMLSEGIATRRGRSAALLHRDLVNRRIRARRGARMLAITSGGAIPDTADFTAVAEPDGAVLGTLDEDFAMESMAGDVFLLGTNSWRIRRVEARTGKVLVEDAHGAAPSVPFWRGEAPGRTAELSEEVSRVRAEIAEYGVQAPTLALLPRLAREQAVAYVEAGRAALGAVPTHETVIAERFFDEAGGMQLVIHAPFGSRVNRAWGLALRKRFCRSFNVELQAAATDNGLVISLTEQHSFPLEAVFEFLHPDEAEHVLTQALLAAPMFATRWRWNAVRALALPRFHNGGKVPTPLVRMRAGDLLAAVFPDQVACAENLSGEIRIPDHPLVKETIRDCLHEAMDLEGLKGVLAAIRAGRVRTLAVETVQASPFSHEILNANPYAYLDDAPLEERRTRAVALRRTLGTELPAGPAALDAEAIAAVEAESWPVVRDPDELHDALLTLILLPAREEWRTMFSALAEAGRAATISCGGRSFWVAAERIPVAARVFPEAQVAPPLLAPPGARPAPETREACVAEVLRGWLESTGPRTARSLAELLGLDSLLVEAALAQLEAEGQILRGRFRSDAGETEWCNRRLLARLHQLTIGRLRREIEPVATADFVRFLFRWQHVGAGLRLHGADGLFQVIRQLQGFECPAAAWESDVLPARIERYTGDLLDELCLSGEVVWGRLSPHPSSNGGQAPRVRPTRVAPIALFLREDFDWLAPAVSGRVKLSYAAQEALEVLERRGASFFADFVRTTRRLPSEVEEALWELLAAGLVTADSFENLRALLDPKRRRGQGRGRLARPRHAGGRWALLRNGEPQAPPAVEPLARQLLLRWGVVFRELTAREPLAPPWRDLLVEFRRLEARGEIRGGRFVAGFLGEQFALPEALDLLRALRRSGNDGPLPEISPADPLNLTGVVLPGPRVSPLAGGRLRLL